MELLRQNVDYGFAGKQAWVNNYNSSSIRLHPRYKMVAKAHAYERIDGVYNYSLDPCGPAYITVGDGGNIEGIDTDFADDPGKCPGPGDNQPEYGGVCHTNFTSGPAKGNFCWDEQPEWSAFRESSFGHGILEVLNSTNALWTMAPKSGCLHR